MLMRRILLISASAAAAAAAAVTQDIGRKPAQVVKVGWWGRWSLG
jgi:hypothetical protein